MQTVGLKRDTKDQFFTKKEIAIKCIDKIGEKINIAGIVIEPSAGDGAFYDLLRLKYTAVLGYDIEPGISSIVQQDFLKLNLNGEFEVPLHFVGNPPFGRQSSLARKFIKHICKCRQSKSISFILPRSFKKPSLQKTFPLNWHLIYQEDVEENAFLVNKKEYDVPCVFQIWIKKETEREIPEKQVPIGYTFVKELMLGRYALRRVGVYAGKIVDLMEVSISPRISKESHYFIKLDEGYVLDKKKYDENNFENNNTVGPRSISKQEFIAYLNNIIQKN